MIPFNAPDEALDDRGLACGKGSVRLEMEGTNGGKVGFNCFGLKPTSPQVCDPFHDATLGCGQAGTVGVDQRRAFSDEIDERFLTSAVGGPGAGRKTVPEVERNKSRVLRVRLIPRVWGLTE